MAVTRIQSKAGINFFGGTSCDVSFDSAAGTGLLAAVVNYGGNATVTSVVDDKSSPGWTLGTLVTQAATHYTNVYALVAYTLTPTSGVVKITANFSAAVSFNFVSSWELTAGRFDQEATGTGNSNTPNAGTVTPTANGAFLVAGATLDDGVGAGGGWTKDATWDALVLDAGGGNQDSANQYYAQAIAASVSSSFTTPAGGAATGPWAVAVMAFKPSTTKLILIPGR